MSSSVLEIPHLYRVEGHGGIRVTVGDQGIERLPDEYFRGFALLGSPAPRSKIF